MTTYISSTASNAIYNWVLKGTAASSGSRYLALYTNIAAGTEASGGSYARQDLSGVFSAPSSGSGSNGSLIVFTGLSANEYDGIGIWTASSGGTELVRGDLVVAKSVAANGTISFSVDAIMAAIKGGA